MNKLSKSLMLYTNGINYDILDDFFELTNHCSDSDKCRELINSITNRLLNTAMDYGFCNNAWQNYIALLAITSDNIFCRACERRETENCTLTDFALRDISILFELFNYDFSDLESTAKSDCFTMLVNYRGGAYMSCVRFPEISKRLNTLVHSFRTCLNANEFFDCICNFYKQYGSGKIGLNRSFRLEVTGNIISLEPIVNSGVTNLDDIIGYDSQKKLLNGNTKAFIDKKPANNVLLYGDSGTGKSTSIKAIVDKFYESGLRMIEVYKHQIERLPALISYLRDKNYRFIIYLDDLSFEDTETEYKYLKAVIDGGAQSKPENVLIYATSNRRHLVKESWQDRGDISDDDIHSADTVEEKLSLVARFGLTIYYPKPGRDEYMNIVKNLALKNNIDIDEKTLQDKARVWEMHHGGISGRTAAQFVADLLGSQ